MAAEIEGIFFDSWNNASDRHLGLQFQINGETHFGWARFNVRFHKGAPKDRTWEAQLTGYAYETTPNKLIKAGDTGGTKAENEHSGPTRELFVTSQPDPELATLGALSLGSTGLVMWRRP